MGYLPGIDISHYQGDVNFPAIKNAGYQFVIMKATEGLGYVDPYIGAYYAAARVEGFEYGTYHFANALDPIAEADHFLNVVLPLDEGQILVLDWEVSHPDPVGWCWQWVSRVHDRTGVWPLIYMSGSRVPAFYGSEVLKYCGLWVAWYDRDPGLDLPLKCPYIMHQYTSSGSVPGIAGRVDMDAFYGNKEQLNKYGYHSSPPSNPQPDPTPVPVPEPDPVPVPVPDPTPTPIPEPEPTPEPEPAPDEPVPTTPPTKPQKSFWAAVAAAIVAALAAVLAWLK